MKGLAASAFHEAGRVHSVCCSKLGINAAIKFIGGQPKYLQISYHQHVRQARILRLEDKSQLLTNPLVSESCFEANPFEKVTLEPSYGTRLEPKVPSPKWNPKDPHLSFSHNALTKVLFFHFAQLPFPKTLRYCLSWLSILHYRARIQPQRGAKDVGLVEQRS
jgi:hypothetical protein